MSGKKPTGDNSREEMELTDLTSVSCELTDENKERLAKEKNKEIRLGGVVEEPCTFSEERSLEDGSHITPVDITQEHPVINTANEEAHALEVERKLDEALREGDFDLLQERITPKTLTSCKTNALFKTFEVNKTLKGLVEKAVNPETDEIQTLSNSLNEFTYAFVDPLRSDSDTRHTFKSCLDFMIDKAIDEGQKKFVSHPVVYNLLNSRWYRSFNAVRKQPWTSLRRWGYMLLSFWTVIDIVVFPFLFAFFYILHFMYLWLRKLRDTDICFVVTLTSDAADEAFGLIKRTIGFLIQKYGLYSAKYCVILRDFNNVSTSKISFEEGYSSETELLNRVEAMQKLISPSWLYKDLSAALAAFKSSSVRKDSKKLLIVFTNGKIRMSRDDGTEDLHPIVDELKEIGARIISVGIGADTTLSEMKKIASKNKTALHFGEYEAPKTLGKAIIHGEEGKDIFDRYLYYFTTPYFVFLRDSLSYLALLGLHFDICLSPSTLAFTKLEWVIFLFFIGRIVIEIDQFMSVKKSRRKEPLERHWTPGKESRQRLYRGSSYEVCASPDDVQVVMTAEENVTRKRLINYFSDRWNMLDFIILIIYLAIFFLRMISWATSSTVYDNRAIAVAGYLYGFVAMFLTLRVFGHVMESIRGMGAKLIAFFSIMWDVFAIFWQFAAMILAFSLAMTKIYVVETSYTSNATSVEDLACSEGGLTCWWTMAQHLSWSCLGISGLEQLDSVDRPSVSLSYLLYGLFLIMVVVLLVNMMIALLSNTYNRVEENSLREWSFKKATTIRSYSSYHPVPVPFNIVSLGAIGLWRLCQGDKGNRFDKSGFDEKGRKAALDRLVERLEKTYFATFGYTFPLTEAKKLDHLLHEIDGSRRMANQIAQRVFAQQGCKQDRYIAGAEAWESLGIGIKGCLLTYEGPDSCHSCKEKEPKSVHGARCLTPFTREKPRIEVLIQESGERRILGLGVVFEGYDSHWMPGWEAGTVGYHVDDGKIFEAGFEDFGRDVEEAMAYRGDLIACEVDFTGVRNGKLPVVFFLNGREIARAWTKRISGEIKVFPFISMAYEGIRVLAKMCPGDSSMSQISHVPSAQRLARDVGIEKELTECLQKQFLKLKDDMEIMERERKVQATEFQERLDKQWQLLTEIRNLVMLSNREGKRKELDEN